MSHHKYGTISPRISMGHHTWPFGHFHLFMANQWQTFHNVFYAEKRKLLTFEKCQAKHDNFFPYIMLTVSFTESRFIYSFLFSSSSSSSSSSSYYYIYIFFLLYFQKLSFLIYGFCMFSMQINESS